MAYAERIPLNLGLIASWWERVDRQVVALIVLSKVVIFLTIPIAYHYLPFLYVNFYSNARFPPYTGISLETPFTTWDAQHYLHLSLEWYSPTNLSNSFYPLFPALIYVLSLVFGDHVLSALIVSNVASIVAVYYLYLLTMRFFHNSRLSLICIALLFTFPTGFYLSLIYTESLFLLFSVCFFYYLYDGNYRICSICAFLLTLTRPTGMLIVGPWLLYHVLANRARANARTLNGVDGARRPIRQRFETARSGPARTSRVPRLLAISRDGVKKKNSIAFIASPIVAYAAYLAMMYIATGDPFSGLKAASNNIGAWHIGNVVHPDRMVADFFRPMTSHWFAVFSYTNSYLDRAFFILFLLGLPLVYIETDIVLFSFYVLLGSVPLLGSFMSYTRYIMPAFPLYIAVARLIVQRRLHVFVVPYLLLSASLSVAFLARQALNCWVS